MPDIKDFGGIAGWIVFALTTIKFWWDRGDREEKRMAVTIEAKGPIRDAVMAVAIAAAEESGRFVSQKMYDEQRETRDEKLDALSGKVDQLSTYVQSDQLPRAIAAAIDGMPMRRLQVRDVGK